jgi:hypothetical protein
MVMEIRAGLLAVLLMGEWYDEELLIFDWKTTQCIAVSHGYSRRSYILKLSTMKRLTHKDVGIDDFRFLSDNVFVVANAWDASLDLFTLSHSQDDTPITNVAKFLLPDISDRISAVSFSNPPAKNGVARSLQVDDPRAFAKPFTNSSNNIIYCHIVATDSQEFSSFSLLVHSSTLLRHAGLHDFKSIPWYEWSSMARCLEGNLRDYPTTCFSGQRWLSSGQILDFNQYRVQQLGLGFAEETETAHIFVVSKEEEVSDWNDGVPSSLPYVVIVPKQSGDFRCLDDDRIFVVSGLRFRLSFLFLMEL